MRPIPELHLHLDGSPRPGTVRELAATLGRPVPKDLTFTPGLGLSAALERFAFTLSLLQTPDAVARVASEICEDASAGGVAALEIRFAPQLHRGAPLGGARRGDLEASSIGDDGETTRAAHEALALGAEAVPDLLHHARHVEPAWRGRGEGERCGRCGRSRAVADQEARHRERTTHPCCQAKRSRRGHGCSLIQRQGGA